MNIAWQYLDKRDATISALKDYESMRFITAQAPEMMPADDTLDALAAKYHQAQAYMAWFQPAWEAITADERFVLQCFYMQAEQQQTDNVYDICEAFRIERTSAYKKKDRALSRLSLMLYGR